MDPISLFSAPIQISIEPKLVQLDKQLKRLAKQADILVLWTDCDREGEAIACEIRDVCRSVRPALRVLRASFAAITGGAIRAAVAPGALRPPDQLQADAVHARRVLDLRLGAVFTRFLTLLLRERLPSTFKSDRSTGGDRISSVISYGPCQFPTLGFIVDRYLQRVMFQPEAFFALQLAVKPLPAASSSSSSQLASSSSAASSQSAAPATASTATLQWVRGRLFDRLAVLCFAEDAEEAVLQSRCVVEHIGRRVQTKRRPLPLTTVELQKRAARWLRISAVDAGKAAESLYQAGLISYPRTETDSFPADFDFASLVREQATHPQWGAFASRLAAGGLQRPREGRSKDNAHEPIYPTKLAPPGSIGDPRQRSVYELVTRHFLACCSSDAKGDLRTVRVRAGFEAFSGSGLVVTDRGYMDVYPYEKWSERAFPDLGDEGSVIPAGRASVSVHTGETTAPELLTESELIATMDKEAIGTDATIADHIQKVEERQYAARTSGTSPERFAPTTLGISLVWAFARLRVPLYRPFLRRAMEADLSAVCAGRKTSAAVSNDCIGAMRPLYVEVQRSQNTLVSAVKTFLHGQGRGAFAEIERFAREQEALRRRPSAGAPEPQGAGAAGEGDGDDDSNDDDNASGRGAGRGELLEVRAVASRGAAVPARNLSAYGGRYLQDDGGAAKRPRPADTAPAARQTVALPVALPGSRAGAASSGARTQWVLSPARRTDIALGAGGRGPGARRSPAHDQRRCSICRQPGHTKRTCPHKAQGGGSPSRDARRPVLALGAGTHLYNVHDQDFE